VKGFAHLTRIALGLTSVTCFILMLLDMAGMIPSETNSFSAKRVSVAEALVTQATLSATRTDMAGLRSLLEISTRRNDDVLSVALRDNRDRILMATRDHDRLWLGAPATGSSQSHMRMPIFNGGSPWATLEISFAPVAPKVFWVMLWSKPSTRLTLAMFVLGFFANLLFMKRVLKHLDPSAVVPARVQTALDVMSDGVLLIDDKERIVLVNSSFCERLNRNSASLLGLPASRLDWQIDDRGASKAELPWLEAIDHGQAHNDVKISIVPEGLTEEIVFRVSGSPVLDGWGKAKGAIATFKDVTQLERQQKELEEALCALEKSRDEIRFQYEELEVLASTDVLTGIANRRTLMDRFEDQFKKSHEKQAPLCCLMVDIDHFKKVNDEYGHGVGDEVISRVADALKDHTRSMDIAGRYGGEEFCVVLVGVSPDIAVTVAERIRKTIAAPGFARVPIAVSIGVSSIEFGADSPSQLMEQADQGLYASKNGGRNRVTRYDEIGTPPAAQV